MLVLKQNILGGLLLTALCMSSINVGGAELRSVSVTRDEEGRYCLTSEALLGASQEDLYAVLTDYELFEKFTSAIVELNRAPMAARVSTRAWKAAFFSIVRTLFATDTCC